MKRNKLISLSILAFVLFLVSCSKEDDADIINYNSNNKSNSNMPVQKTITLMEDLSFSLDLSHEERIELIEPLILNLENYPNTSLQFSVDFELNSVQVTHVGDTTFNGNVTHSVNCVDDNLHLCNQWAMSRLDEGCALSARQIFCPNCADGSEYKFWAVC